MQLLPCIIYANYIQRRSPFQDEEELPEPEDDDVDCDVDNEDENDDADADEDEEAMVSHFTPTIDRWPLDRVIRSHYRYMMIIFK